MRRCFGHGKVLLASVGEQAVQRHCDIIDILKHGSPMFPAFWNISTAIELHFLGSQSCRFKVLIQMNHRRWHSSSPRAALLRDMFFWCQIFTRSCIISHVASFWRPHIKQYIADTTQAETKYFAVAISVHFFKGTLPDLNIFQRAWHAAQPAPVFSNPKHPCKLPR